ncbi:hypothetical protein SDC9_212693 [bioreactor metagenome]|uniref:Uncharacterized protein n=1 Tax=bioreactor metagenome TaxID=1076179 RepID=A0A645JZY8_9ZZZZ
MGNAARRVCSGIFAILLWGLPFLAPGIFGIFHGWSRLGCGRRRYGRLNSPCKKRQRFFGGEFGKFQALEKHRVRKPRLHFVACIGRFQIEQETIGYNGFIAIDI